MTINIGLSRGERERFFSKFPVMKLGDLILRPIQYDDAEDYFEMLSNPEVTKYSSDEDIPSNISEARDDATFWGSSFQRRQGVFWAIARSDNNRLIGTVGLISWNFYNSRSEICYDLRQEYWRKGVMSMALKMIIDFAFLEMKLCRIEARTMLGNISSQAILRKMRFQQEGITRNYRVIRNAIEDVTIYSLVPQDWFRK